MNSPMSRTALCSRRVRRNLGSSSSTSPRGRHRYVDNVGKERKKRLEIREEGGHHPSELGEDDVVGGVGGPTEQPAKDVAKSQVRRRSPILFACHSERVERPSVDCLRHEPGLADARRPNDLDDAPGAAGNCGSPAQDDLELHVTAHEGQTVAALCRRIVVRLPNGNGQDGLGLALDLERWHRFGLKPIADPAEGLRGGKYLTWPCLAHDASCQVDGVPGYREDPPVSEADVVREDEDPSGVDTDAKPERRVRRVG